MAKLFWHILIREQDNAYTLPTALAKKIRTTELKAGHARGVQAATARPVMLMLESALIPTARRRPSAPRPSRSAPR